MYSRKKVQAARNGQSNPRQVCLELFSTLLPCKHHYSCLMLLPSGPDMVHKNNNPPRQDVIVQLKAYLE